MLLTDIRGQATAVIAAAPAEVFSAITAIDSLPEWNPRIKTVLEGAPGMPLAEGAEWTVQMSIPVPPASWPSRSRVRTFDPARMLFEHTSRSDDGNPSYVDWRWQVIPAADGARVTVEWSGHIKTFWRQLLFARMRRTQLRGETQASLDALARCLGHEAPGGWIGRPRARPGDDYIQASRQPGE